MLISPFFISHLFLSKIFTPIKAELASDFLPSFILAVVFYISAAYRLTYKVCNYFGLKHIKKSIFFYATSTSLLWYFVFSSTNSNIIALFYSSVALLFFIELDEHNNYYDLIVGLCAGFGFILRIQLIWILLFPLYRYLKHRRISHIKNLFFFLGFIFPVILMSLNNFIQFGSISNPLSIYFSHFWSIDFLTANLTKSFIGPNSFVQTSPIYVAILPALFLGLKSELKDMRYILICISLAMSSLFIFYNSLWPVMDGVIGRHLLSYFFIFIVSLSSLFTYIEKKSNRYYYSFVAVLSFCSILYLLNISRILYFDTRGEFWKLFLDNFSLAFLLNNDIHLIGTVTSTDKFIKSLLNLIYFLPIIILCSFILHKISSSTIEYLKKYAKYFIVTCVVTYSFFTALNFYFNQKNVSKDKISGTYNDTVIANDKSAFVFDDFTEVYGNTVRYYYFINDCQMVQKLNSMYDLFLQRVNSSIVKDPINFSKKLTEKKLKSNIEGDKAIDFLKEMERTKCLL